MKTSLHHMITHVLNTLGCFNAEIIEKSLKEHLQNRL